MKKRSLASLFLAISLLLTIASPMNVFAEEQLNSALQTDSLSEIDFDIITSNLTYLVVDPANYSKIEVGNYVPAYVWDGSNLISSEDEVLFYPIYGDDQIVAILTMFDPLGDKSYTVGVDFAAELNNAISDGTQNFFIVEAGSKIFLYSEGEASLLKQYAEPAEVDAEALESSANNETAGVAEFSASTQGPETDGAPNVSDGLVSDYDASNSLTVSELTSVVNSEAEQYSYFTETAADHATLDITPASYRPTRTIRYLPIGTKSQGATEKCTYFATSLIGNYKSNPDYTPDKLISMYGDADGKGNIRDAQTCLYDYYGLDYSRIYNIYGGAANEFIERGWPLYAAFYDSSVTMGHALAVCGYDDAGNSGIYVSETLTNSYKAIYPSSASTYITRAYSRDCYWTETLFYQYW